MSFFLLFSVLYDKFLLYCKREVREINYTRLAIILAIVIVILIVTIYFKKDEIQRLRKDLQDEREKVRKASQEQRLLTDQLSDCRKASEILQSKADRLSNYARNYKLDYEELIDCKNELASLTSKINEKANLQFRSVMREFAYHSPFAQSDVFRYISSGDIIQDERFMNAFTDKSMSLLSVPDVCAKVKGQSGEVYEVTLESCTCKDFRFNHKPCKHMFRLAIHMGAISYMNTDKAERALQAYICEEEKLDRDKADLAKERKALEKALLELEQQRTEIKNYNNDCYTKFLTKLKSHGYNPTWIAKMYGDYYDMFTDRVLVYLTARVRPAHKSASEIKKSYKSEMRAMAEKAKYNESLVTLYESFFPNLPALCEFTAEDTPQTLEELPELEDDPKYDSIRKWLTQDEYALLPREEKFQLALDNYKRRKRSNWEAGRDYERYVCYLYEKQGYKVVCYGALNGLADLGRDLYASKGNDVIVIQCKRWAPQKTIHEKHVYQLFGTVTDYSVDNKSQNAYGLLLATCGLSDKAKEVAERIGIKYEENAQFPDYPLIKCNIGSTGERIYHLPFDQQYDKVQIDYAAGEFYADSIKQAERKGFRRAQRHRKAAEQ